MSTNVKIIKPCSNELIDETSCQNDEMNERCNIVLLDTVYNIQAKENNLKSLNTNNFTNQTNNSPEDKMCMII
jgi:hypothetical protein